MQLDKARLMADQARSRIDAAKKAAGGAKDNETINKAAEEFEAVFLAQMMEHMFADVSLSPGSEGPGDEIYKSLLLDEYSKLIARSGGVGVADHVKREMLRIQEQGEHPPAANLAPNDTVETENTVAANEQSKEKVEP